MSSRSTPRETFTVEGEHLSGLAAVLVRSVALRPGDAAQLIRVRIADDAPSGDEVEVGLRTLEDSAHPLEALVGFHAPGDWAALGVVATGQAHHQEALSSTEPFPVRSAHLVGRDGNWASSWHPLADGHGEGGESSGTGGESPGGRLDDALRLALGLDTAPPPDGTCLLWATVWLDALLASAAANPTARRRRRSLEALVALHPVVAAFDLDPAAVRLPDLVAEGNRLATWRDWSQLRRACAARLWPHPEIDPATAAWLDDGAFARWVLASWPELDDLRNALEALLAPSAMTAVDDALAGWGLT